MLDPDIPRELAIACHSALPVFCVQTKSIDVLKDIYELDLSRYLSLHRNPAKYFADRDVDNMITFFKWMEIKVRFEVISYITSDG